MPTIRILPDDREIQAAPEETLLAASLRENIPHAHACGGRGRCSTCRVLVMESTGSCPERNEIEQKMADRMGFCPAVRLACQVPCSGDVTLRRLVLDEIDLEMAREAVATPAPGQAGEEREVAVLFSDIRGFTPFAESFPPYDVIHVLQRYFRHMSSLIHARRGVVNNLMGDGLMALFGTRGEPDACLDAVRAGLEMVAAMKRMQPYFQDTYERTLEIGVGIHHGRVVLGKLGVGGEERLTAIGDVVNLASRIESANKLEDTRLLVSEATYRQVADRVTRGRIVATELKGKSGRYDLHEIVGLREPLPPA